MKKKLSKIKFRNIIIKYLSLIFICIIFIFLCNIIVFSIIDNRNVKKDAVIYARNLLKIGDRSRNVIDKLWNLNYIDNNQDYFQKYNVNNYEIIPVLIGIDNIRESIENLSFNYNNEMSSKKIELSVLKFSNMQNIEIFKEPNSIELYYMKYIRDTGYGDYSYFDNGNLIFYRPIIANHNRLLKNYNTQKGEIIAFYKLTLPKEIINSFSSIDTSFIIIINLLAILITIFIFFLLIKEKIKQIIKIDKTLNKMKHGDFTSKIELKTKDEFNSISISINEIISHIQDMGREMNSLVEYLLNSSETFHKFSSELSASSKKQFIQIREINQTIANITGEISNSTQLAGDINAKSKKSLSTATESNNYVNEVIEDMVELTKSTRRIEDILKIIKEIAFQTNLLAHNASIEAARAGEQGKGFSVVAQSVSELAKKSADSTKEIEELIKNSINGLDLGTEKVKNFGNNFQMIKTQLDETAKLINEINQILRQQNEESYHVKESINRINKISHESSQKAILMEKNINELKSKTSSLKSILLKNTFSDNGIEEKNSEKIKNLTIRKDTDK